MGGYGRSSIAGLMPDILQSFVMGLVFLAIRKPSLICFSYTIFPFLTAVTFSFIFIEKRPLHYSAAVSRLTLRNCIMPSHPTSQINKQHTNAPGFLLIFEDSTSYHSLKTSGSLPVKIKNLNTFLPALLIPIAVGILSALFSGVKIYTTFNKPPLSPPGFIFPIVWLFLYALMGVSSYLIYESNSPYREAALKTYILQLFFNFMWSILFFRFSLYFLALMWLFVMVALILIMIYQFYHVKPAAAYLQIPYLLWCLFAIYLNFMIAILN